MKVCGGVYQEICGTINRRLEQVWKDTKLNYCKITSGIILLYGSETLVEKNKVLFRF
jgi:hypothetical protein